MFVLIMYVVLVILSIVNARLANNKISKICWCTCSVLWGLCAAINLIELIP